MQNSCYDEYMSTNKVGKKLVAINDFDLDKDFFESEKTLINQAISVRRSHFKSPSKVIRIEAGLKHRKMGTCPSGKQRYRYQEEASHVLHLVQNTRRLAEEAGKETRFKQYRIYQCGKCNGGFHLSSKPAHASLESFNVA